MPAKPKNKSKIIAVSLDNTPLNFDDTEGVDPEFNTVMEDVKNETPIKEKKPKAKAKPKAKPLAELVVEPLLASNKEVLQNNIVNTSDNFGINQTDTSENPVKNKENTSENPVNNIGNTSEILHNLEKNASKKKPMQLSAQIVK